MLSFSCDRGCAVCHWSLMLLFTGLVHCVWEHPRRDLASHVAARETAHTHDVAISPVSCDVRQMARSMCFSSISCGLVRPGAKRGMKEGLISASCGLEKSRTIRDSSFKKIAQAVQGNNRSRLHCPRGAQIARLKEHGRRNLCSDLGWFARARVDDCCYAIVPCQPTNSESTDLPISESRS